MPPVMKARDESVRLISEDPEIEMFDTSGSKYVFTDITFGIPNRVCNVYVLCFTNLVGEKKTIKMREKVQNMSGILKSLVC